MAQSINLETKIKQTKAVFAQSVDEDIVMLHVNQGKYFASNHVARAIWVAIEEPKVISAICDSLMESFEGISRQHCEEQTLSFIEAMVEANLIELVNA